METQQLNEVEKLNAIFQHALESLPGYAVALDIAKSNTKGDLYLIGGTVSRVLVRELYEIPLHEFDYDFICDELIHPAVIPNGWSVSYHKFGGNPTFTKGDLEVDVWPISSHTYIRNHHLPPQLKIFWMEHRSPFSQ